MIFKDFTRIVDISRDDIYREVAEEHSRSIKIKKEKTLEKNLGAIFDAALRVSNVRGFTAMSMRDLSREAGLSMGALYAYFSSKEELLEMLLQTGRAIIWRVLNERLAQVADPRAKLRTAMETHLYLSEALQPWFYFSYMEARHLSERQKEAAKAAELETETLFADIIEEGNGRGRFSSPDARLSAALIKAVLQDWYVKRWKYAKRKVSVDRYAGFVIDFVEASLLTPELPKEREWEGPEHDRDRPVKTDQERRGA
ncbi:MAG: TetR/AcrR family transcriptional regulator [Pseudomonadota bacterium]